MSKTQVDKSWMVKEGKEGDGKRESGHVC